jgi:predicted ATPase with chaperone activity
MTTQPLAVEQPTEPTSIEETGLSKAFLTQLMAKTLYVAAELTELSACRELKLSYPIIRELLTSLCMQKLCEIKGGGDGSGMVFRYQLTDSGLARAQDYMEVCHYVGPAPVTLKQFEAIVCRQSALALSFKRPLLEQALGQLVVQDEVRDQLGAAVNSGAPVFLYGESGNGKTVIAQALGEMLSGEEGGAVLFPYAVEVDDQVIELYDPSVHVACAASGSATDAAPRRGLRADDMRWVPCRRPAIFAGGELTLPMLDLSFNPVSKYYAAPPQVKASGGVFIIDDFGRQQAPPGALLNRWIVPLEKRVDYLTLHTGKKFRVPFDTLVIFCTNIEPRKLVDEAFLRRMRNKIYVGDPTAEEFSEIFRRNCDAHGIPFDPSAVDYLREQYYEKHGLTPRACHPRDLVHQIVSIAKFHEIPPSLDRSLLDRACRNYLLLSTIGEEAGAVTAAPSAS